MSKNKGKINAVMLGVGAAFNIHADKIKRAPLWMQRIGLEWLYRLIKEPRRLWRRYLYTNLKFIKLLVTETLVRGSR
jgi:N-acetylglucosaminyldiphosphoundecaprenol N-acetyl-beta-D-mannosaminyltransferase